MISELTRVPMSALKADGPKASKPKDEDHTESPRQFMSELNDKHAVVPLGGRVLILNRETDPTLRRKLVSFSSRTDFLLRYENRSTRKSGEDCDIGTYWLKSRDRRQHDGIVFFPGGNMPGFFNLWEGWGIEPKPGSCDRFIDFIGEVICGGDSQLFAFVWGWTAHLFQKPARLPGTALVLRGKQGTGKNTFAETLGRLVGPSFTQLNSISQVTGKFSGHLADALLVFANEAIWGGDKSAEGALKAMITDQISPIESKGKDIRTCRNYKRVIAASNEDWVVPRGADDRRWVVLDVSDKYKQNREYFSRINQELRSGGYRALMHELMTSSLDSFDPADVPEAIMLKGWDLKIRSAGSIERWWYEILVRGYLYRDSGSYADDESESRYVWPDVTPNETVQNSYLKWCERHRIAHPEGIETLGAYLARLGLKKTRPRQGNQRVYAYAFQNIQDMREIFGQRFGIPREHWVEADA